jgi:hypothetical protein
MRDFENGVLRNLIGRNREEVTRGFRKLLTEELRKLCSTLNVVRIIKSKRM